MCVQANLNIGGGEAVLRFLNDQTREELLKMPLTVAVCEDLDTLISAARAYLRFSESQKRDQKK